MRKIIGNPVFLLIYALILFCHNPAAEAVVRTISDGETVNMSIIEGADDDELQIPSLSTEFFTNGSFEDFGGGIDSITVTGAGGNFSAVEIHPGGVFRNFERAYLSENGNDSWTVTNNDVLLEFIDARGGADTLSVGNLLRNSDGIGASGLYRNFEHVTLSDGDDIWVRTSNDTSLESINAGGGTDTLETSVTDSNEDGFLSIADSTFSLNSLMTDAAFANYLNFEQVAVSTTDANDTWVSSTNEEISRWQWINARGGIDTLALGDGDHSAVNINSSSVYRNFEQVTLSDNDNIWTVTDNDGGLSVIDALGGTADTVVFGDGNHSGNDLTKYLNFNRATLSENDNTWTIGSNDSDLEYVDALGGTDTVILGDGVTTSSQLTQSRGYRNFERAFLSNNDNNWTVTDNDQNLESINAGGGTDTLETSITDLTGDGLLSIADSAFSVDSLATDAAFANYSNFEQVAVSTTDADDTWVASTNEETSRWQWVNAGGGTDTLTLGDGNHSAANINSLNGFYRNFERTTLSDNDNTWSFTVGDSDLEVIDALGGTDTLALGAGSHSANNIHSSGHYRNFERVTLSDGADTWAETSNDINLESIDALGGTDILEIMLRDGQSNNSYNADDISSTPEQLLASPEYGNYSNFERIAIGMTDENDTWVVNSAADFTTEWTWINARGGTDTLALGDGNHSSANMSIGGRYRNFEQVILSDNNNRWTVTENDRGLENIDALGGTDTIAFGNGSHNGEVLSRYRNFEQATLSDEDNVWFVGANDSDLNFIDAMNGSDALVFGDGNHSAVNVNSSSGLYRNFEQAFLSDAENTWAATDSDFNLEYIDALGGTDTLALGDRSGSNVSANGIYRNFEQVTLSENDNRWTVTDNNRSLSRVDALGGTDTLAFGDGNHSAVNVNSDGIYRNFERVTLSDNNNIWTITDNDQNLESINAGGGTDMLEEILEDANNDNSFNAADSSFSVGDLTMPAYGNYSNFEQVAVATSDNNDIWVVSASDSTSGWQWINALGGTDTLAFGDGNHSAVNINSSDGLYRNFEQVTLSDNDNMWTVTENGRGLENIDALGGTDTAIFGDGNHDGSALARLQNFERAELSDNDNMWTVSVSDSGIEYIDALDGTDTINVNASVGTTRVLNGNNVGADKLYRNFESLRKTGEGILSIERTVDLGTSGNLSVEQGNLSFNIVIEIPASGGNGTAANSGKIIAGSIHTAANSSINVRGLSAFDLSQTANMSIPIFEGDTAGIDENTEITDPGLFTDVVHEDNGLRVAFDSPEGARQEIETAFNGSNPRELATVIQASLVAGRVDQNSSITVEEIGNGRTSEAQITELIPSEHGGVDYEIIDLQRKFFSSIEDRVVEAVHLMLWESPQPAPTYRIFGGGFEKTSSGNLYEIGSRGFFAGIHRLLFNERMGVGIAGAASFLETTGERVTEKTEGFHGAIYTKYDHGRLSATGIVSAGVHDYESERFASTTGIISGESDVLVYGAKVSAGVEMLKNLPVRIKPEASFMFGRSSIDPYRETGGLGISLKTRETTSTEAGLKINIAFNPLKTVLRTTVQPEIEGGIYYDFSADNKPAPASLFNTDYNIFRNGTEDKLRYAAGGKIIMSDNKHLALKIGYEVEFREDMRHYTGSAQFHVRF
ncbi:MAG: hypothetical protein GKS04_01895 [Candidatus Mycalebacterium zealandia]|nr:MAG: hypothetical protein GKS04_01895 [Candidatus Mycalebacterium zealandia]